jgi:hypothetical protein
MRDSTLLVVFDFVQNCVNSAFSSMWSPKRNGQDDVTRPGRSFR